MNDIIEAKALSLDKFLEVLFSQQGVNLYPDNHFPTDEMLNQFILTISNRKDDEIKNILRKFIIHSQTFGSDMSRADTILGKIRGGEKISQYSESEYYRRLINKMSAKNSQVWEGLTWTLDLLPHFPLEAIRGIDAYSLANCQSLPDSCIHALSDCTTIIRARYINYEHPREVFVELPPKDFELLVASLCEELGYEVRLTKASHDGGVDVHAVKKGSTRKEYLLVQCKRYKKTIGVGDIRELLGVVSDAKATKGVLVTSSKFSYDAIKFADNNPRIELIGFDDLNSLFNSHFGTYWPNKIDKLISQQRQKLISA